MNEAISQTLPDPLLAVEDLSVVFRTDEGLVHAVDGVSFRLFPGEVLGIVGESGCGKSVTALSTLRLIPSPPGRITGGRVHFDGKNLLGIPIRKLRRIRGNDISMVFQEPMTALSPLHRIGKQMVETLQTHRDIGRKEAWHTGADWLTRVGIADAAERMYAWPHQLSGGMRQRVMIAMALMLHPRLVIADEPTTALDVTIQAQIFELMQDMKQRDMGLILITHDMGVIWEMCTRVVVMYASEVVEQAAVGDLFGTPLHPYTEALLEAIPSLDGPRGRLQAIEGQVPSAIGYPAGCRFRDRCRYAFDRCSREHPPLYRLGTREARCFLREKEAG